MEISAENLQSSNSPAGPRKRVLIVGGSTRAAAGSALRAGFQPICADLFADVDTQQAAKIVPVRSYPDSLPDDVADVVADGWFYTGALENRPDLIERLARPDAPYGQLWGTPACALRSIRDPFWVAEVLRRQNAPVLNVLPQSQVPPADGAWMLKPLASAGGRAVSVWDRQRQLRPVSEPVYFQRRVEGVHLSGLYEMAGDTLKFHGFTRQQVFHALSGATSPFLYSGSIGPLDAVTASHELNERLRQDLTGRVTILAQEIGLAGIFGVDFILDPHGVSWILEVNPRYTASFEILELAYRRPLLPLPGHGHIPPQTAHTASPETVPVVAKTILYARHPLIAPDLSELLPDGSVWDVPKLADVPIPGSGIDAHWPICTVMSEGRTESECLRRLRDRVDTVREMVNHRSLGDAKSLAAAPQLTSKNS